MRRNRSAFAGFELVYVGTEPEADADLGAVRYYPVRNVSRSNATSRRASSGKAGPRDPPGAARRGDHRGGARSALALGKALAGEPDDLDRLYRQHRADVHVGAHGAARGRRLAGAMGAPRPAGGGRTTGGAVL